MAFLSCAYLYNMIVGQSFEMGGAYGGYGGGERGAQGVGGET
jgi:hypothetical protein